MSQKTMKQIGAELRKARLNRGLTQVEVAQKASIGEKRYPVIERGEAKNITINTFEDICKALEIKGSKILPF